MDRRWMVIVGVHLLFGAAAAAERAPGVAAERPQAATSERPVRRPDAVRTLSHRDPVIQEALTLLGQPINPVQVAGSELVRRVYARTPGAGPPPPHLRAFRAGDRRDPLIYVVRRSREYARAQAGDTALAVLALAGTLVHEQVHNSDGEHAATRLEADFVRSRVSTLPRSEWVAASLYLFRLDQRAEALDRVERRLRAERIERRTLVAGGR